MLVCFFFSGQTWANEVGALGVVPDVRERRHARGRQLCRSGLFGCEARHIVDFRHGSWYREDVYDLLRPRKWKGHGGSAARRQRWCLAWLHLKNSGWASNLPSGWTDRVQTTDFCFCRLFGPDGGAT